MLIKWLSVPYADSWLKVIGLFLHTVHPDTLKYRALFGVIKALGYCLWGVGVGHLKPIGEFPPTFYGVGQPFRFDFVNLTLNC